MKVKGIKRTVQIGLTFLLCLSLIPASAFATAEGGGKAAASFVDLPVGISGITVSEGDEETGKAIKDAFVAYCKENITTEGELALIDYRYEDGGTFYHTWIVTIQDNAVTAVDGGSGDLNSILYAVNNPVFDWWVNGSYSASHTVTVQNDGNGTAWANKTSATQGETVTLTATPYAGYHFKEWQSSDVTISGDTFVMPEKDVTVKAIFEEDAPVAYTIIAGADSEWVKESSTGLAFTSDAPFAAFEGVQVDDATIAPANYTVEAGSTRITLLPAYLETLSVGPHVIKIVSSDGSASTNFAVAAAPQPPVEPANYTVTFNMNGHGSQIAAQTVKEGEKVAKPADPTANGYTFDAWYADAQFLTKFDFNAAINEDTTLYAKWTKNPVQSTDSAIPKTGDSAHMFFWLALLLVSGAALVGTTVYRNKKQRSAR